VPAAPTGCFRRWLHARGSERRDERSWLRSRPLSSTRSQSVAKSLVTLDGSAPTGSLSLLETTRAYALEKLAESGRSRKVGATRAEFFRDLVGPAAYGSQVQPTFEDMARYGRRSTTSARGSTVLLPRGRLWDGRRPDGCGTRRCVGSVSGSRVRERMSAPWTVFEPASEMCAHRNETAHFAWACTDFHDGVGRTNRG